MNWFPSTLSYKTLYLFLLLTDKVCLRCTYHQTIHLRTQGGLPISWWYLFLNCTGQGITSHVCCGCSSLVTCSLQYSRWIGYLAAATMDWPLLPVLGSRSIFSGTSVCKFLWGCAYWSLWCRRQLSLVHYSPPRLLAITAKNPPYFYRCLPLLIWAESGSLLLPGGNFRLILSWVHDSTRPCDWNYHNYSSLPWTYQYFL